MIKRGLYNHHKGGMYVVSGVATHSESGELLVIHQALQGDFRLTARPLAHFTGEVAWVDGISRPRFILVQELP